MVSAINATLPMDGAPASKSALRANLAAAKSEIEALQDATASVSPYVFNGMRNRLLNGSMALDQRYGGTAVSVPAGSTVYGPDRWYGQSLTGGGVFSLQRVASGGPNRFPNYLRVLTTTAKGTLVAGDAHALVQAIEGYHWYDMMYGTTDAVTVTLSFWVRASITGTYAVALVKTSSTDSIASSFIVSTPNTWEHKTVSFVGNTTGTWVTGGDTAIGLRFDLGSGSDYVAVTPNAWTATGRAKVSGTVSPISTLNATLDITGVQLEPGTVATPYDHRLAMAEFFVLQRYYSAGQFNWGGYNVAGGGEILHVAVAQNVRTSPTVAVTNQTVNNLSSYTITPTAYGFYLTATITSTGAWAWAANYAADSEIIA